MPNWPEDPEGDMTPILDASIEAAMARHPSGKALAVSTTETETLTALDRCDACPAAAAYRLRNATGSALDFCGHHFRDSAAKLWEAGFTVVAGNPEEVGAPVFDGVGA